MTFTGKTTWKSDTLRCAACGVPVYASKTCRSGWRSRLSPNEEDCGLSDSGFHEVKRDD